ncbi:alkaline phosphatase family protein [Nocardia sp. NPDC057668]|uniref:alkaline phosphatase family protein n=1 Tax=Nocardia sp. NPDC057668 TaxID=3346202 RepID=UPI00366B31DA
MDRRGFLRGAGTAGALSLLPPSLVRAWARARPAGGLEQVEHVVILMQENRSLDHYYGTFPGVRGYADLNALQLPSGRSVFHQPHGDGFVLPFATELENLDGCDHSAYGGHRAVADGRWDGWIAAKGAGTMAGYRRRSLEFYHQLAAAFTVCDRNHCSFNGATDPNRLFLFTGAARNPFAIENVASTLQQQLYATPEVTRWTDSLPETAVADVFADALLGVSATSEPVVAGVSQALGLATSQLMFSNAALRTPEGRDLLREAITGLRWSTYAERLQAAGVGWRVYQEWDNYGDNSLEYFATFRAAARNALRYTDSGGGTPFRTFYSYYRALLGAPQLADGYERALRRGLDELADGERALVERGLLRAPEGQVARSFRADVEGGRLPAVSWIVLPEAQSEHPVYGPRNGQAVVRELLAAVSDNREVWDRTVVILNYDENDGFFDHVPAPVPPPGTPDEFLYGYNLGLGARVPLLVVSPWSKQQVCSELFDHTSVLRFLERVTGVEEPEISAWRRELCGDLTSVLDFASAAAPVLPAAAPAAPQPSSGAPQAVPAEQRLPQQDSGSAARVPLPYRLGARARGQRGAGTLTVTLGNRGTACTHYTVHPNAFAENFTPERFDVGAGGEVARDFPAPGGRYDYSVYGADGFQRRWAGDLCAPGGALEVDAAAAVSGSRTVEFAFANTGSAAAEFVVVANAYRADGPWRVRVPAGEARGWTLDCAGDDVGAGWYDLSVTCDVDAGFLRRARGFVETGARGRTADDAAPFDRLLLDRSMYEAGRALVVSYALAEAADGHRLAVYPDPGATVWQPPATPPLRTLPLPAGVLRAEAVLPVEGALPAGAYVLHHLNDAGRSLAHPVRFRVL